MSKEDILNKHLNECKYESDKELSADTYNRILDAMEEYRNKKET